MVICSVQSVFIRSVLLLEDNLLWRHLITECYFKDLHAVVDYWFTWLCEPL